jgi:hypothetical protein
MIAQRGEEDVSEHKSFSFSVCVKTSAIRYLLIAVKNKEALGYKPAAFAAVFVLWLV